MAAAPSLNQAFERASHQASGVATTSSESVEMVASSIVSLIGTQISLGIPNMTRFGTFKKSEESFRRLAVRSGLQQHRILTDRRMEVRGNFPLRPGSHAMKLRERDEPQFRIPRINELERLRDAVALHDL